ncbi:MAG: hypothetical protein HC927_13055, partial [Deltaproteobacteria bacterium]|nr:hypothetical protein [Deltaproteobacteria bacterium]
MNTNQLALTTGACSTRPAFLRRLRALQPPTRSRCNTPPRTGTSCSPALNANGLLVYTNDDKVAVRPPRFDGTAVCTLQY